MSNLQKKEKRWLKPIFDFDNDEPTKKRVKTASHKHPTTSPVKSASTTDKRIINIDHKTWMKNFDPVTVGDLAVNNKKVQEIEEWLKIACSGNCGEILLLTGPVGCGKTITIQILAKQHNIKLTEWITPIDISLPSEYGDYEYREKQSTKFLDFIINAANFTSLLDNNSKKLVLVEDLPNTFTRTPSEFTDVLQQFKQRAKSPIVFICSESHTDSKNTGANLFTPSLKDQFKIHHITLNSISVTGLRSALKRVAEIIYNKHTSVYTVPSSEMIDCIVNSSAGDVRSAVLNLHFACLRGSQQSMETSIVMEKETKTKSNKRKKQASSKFTSLGKDQTVSILHGVGRVLNPKMVLDDNGKSKLSHSPEEIIEQFVSQPNSFVNFIQENYLPHFACPYQTERAASILSDADFMLAEWREKMCLEYGLYAAVAGLMLANRTPVSAWNPVRRPTYSKIQYP
ncbi:hypothetical protein O3G_MSEX003015 [Manduca sexta]|uniref:Cell cycle checkpoint protein RAD17 n=2 Tax=Manduca sexta TaxID=7130 RepID=A0A921YRB2_MANSE|nr:hypothetical protein O3G_MSEX003015 [Manduca sexta]